jgi:hypothetical protein
VRDAHRVVCASTQGLGDALEHGVGLVAPAAVVDQQEGARASRPIRVAGARHQ